MLPTNIDVEDSLKSQRAFETLQNLIRNLFAKVHSRKKFHMTVDLRKLIATILRFYVRTKVSSLKVFVIIKIFVCP